MLYALHPSKVNAREAIFFFFCNIFHILLVHLCLCN